MNLFKNFFFSGAFMDFAGFFYASQWMYAAAAAAADHRGTAPILGRILHEERGVRGAGFRLLLRAASLQLYSRLPRYSGHAMQRE